MEEGGGETKGERGRRVCKEIKGKQRERMNKGKKQIDGVRVR